MANMLETIEDWFEFYQTLQGELREKLTKADKHDLRDFRLNELSDIQADAQWQIQSLCKRLQTLNKRVDSTFPPNRGLGGK